MFGNLTSPYDIYASNLIFVGALTFTAWFFSPTLNTDENMLAKFITTIYIDKDVSSQIVTESCCPFLGLLLMHLSRYNINSNTILAKFMTTRIPGQNIMFAMPKQRKDHITLIACSVDIFRLTSFLVLIWQFWCGLQYAFDVFESST